MMKRYEVHLSSPVATSFHCTKAANSLDIDQNKKSRHDLVIDADVESDFNVGVIVGASGSGKTTLAKQIWGDDVFRDKLDPGAPILDQLPEDMDYDTRARTLSGIGLTHVPCWIRPAYTLSNGQRVRAEAALQMADMADDVVVIDEWTSVVDRTVAKVMSHCVQKHARRNGHKVVLVSCHYDVLEWLRPDWVIDCNSASYADRRSVQQPERTEQLEFAVRSVGRETWPSFSRYHYLSDRLPGGRIETYGLFHGDNQIGFQCFANYVPRRKGKPLQMHSNRTVIHPDYAGLGLGIRLINVTSAIMARKGIDVRAKFSSVPVYKAMKRQPFWHYQGKARPHKVVLGGNMLRDSGFRIDVPVHMFSFSLPHFESDCPDAEAFTHPSTVPA